MQLVINRTEMQAIVDTMMNSLVLDDLTERQTIACETLHSLFFMLIDGSTIQEAIEELCGKGASEDYAEELSPGRQS